MHEHLRTFVYLAMVCKPLEYCVSRRSTDSPSHCQKCASKSYVVVDCSLQNGHLEASRSLVGLNLTDLDVQAYMDRLVANEQSATLTASGSMNYHASND